MRRSGWRYGQWALVAGASEGLGAAFAAQLAARGMNLVLVARRSHLLANLKEQLTATYGIEVRCFVIDLADPACGEALAESVAGIDLGIVVYNAAFTPVGPFLDAESEEIEQAVDVNVRGPLLALRALVPPMCKRGTGAVVLMSSLAGLQGTPNISVYAASKAFNLILAEGLWYELRSHGIDVVACCAGAMRTPGYVRSFGRDVPGMLSPDEAARRTLDGLGRGPRLVPGRINQITALLMGRVLPRRAAVRLIGRNTKHLT
ncbi:SDR family NAD(P)-dependent oxidoreductase [Candidatus Poriferisodalis sp.]|uniref:SDR family NAD(P)-dependent oxidoreductase n=1 Tax=Candidatus Poriferisodalis sp. TaxID=3101277 RepID=UPI003B0264D4